MANTFHHGDKAKERLHGKLWHWWGNEPKWWRRMMHSRRRRAANRRHLHRVMRGEYDQVWPLDRKPHEYYW